jgi:hypothetical protein
MYQLIIILYFSSICDYFSLNIFSNLIIYFCCSSEICNNYFIFLYIYFRSSSFVFTFFKVYKYIAIKYIIENFLFIITLFILKIAIKFT